MLPFFKPQVHFLLSITKLNFLYIPKSPDIFLLDKLKKSNFLICHLIFNRLFPINSECRAERKNPAFVTFFLLKQSKLEKHWELQPFKREGDEFILHVIPIKMTDLHYYINI